MSRAGRVLDRARKTRPLEGSNGASACGLATQTDRSGADVDRPMCRRVYGRARAILDEEGARRVVESVAALRKETIDVGQPQVDGCFGRLKLRRGGHRGRAPWITHRGSGPRRRHDEPRHEGEQGGDQVTHVHAHEGAKCDSIVGMAQEGGVRTEAIHRYPAPPRRGLYITLREV